MEDENKMICSHCGCVIEEMEDYAYDEDSGDSYCEACKDNHLYWCERCESYHTTSHHIVDIDEYWCDDCYHNYTWQCEHCGDTISENCGDNDYPLCQYCRDNHYYRCENCGDLICDDSVYWCDDGPYCQCCYDNIGYEIIRDYSYTPDLNFLHTQDENPSEKPLLYLGFELEAGGLDSSDDAKEIAEEIADDETTRFFTEDGSIPGDGFEMVSMPCTLDYHRGINWQDTLATMARRGLRSHDLGAEGCGLHVHASRDYLTDFQWLFLDWFVSRNQRAFEKIARRKECHWARFKNNEKGNPIKEVYGKQAYASRYQAVNFCNYSTVEFRLFRGTLKYDTFIATLEIVDCLCNWAKQVKMHDILSAGDSFLVFTDYMQDNKSRYENAIIYLASKHLLIVKLQKVAQ